MASEILRCGCAFSIGYLARTNSCADHEGFPENISMAVEIAYLKSDLFECMAELTEERRRNV